MWHRFMELAAHLAEAWPAKLGLALLVTLFGPWRDAYGALLIMLILDFITGVGAALKEHTASSAIARQKTVAKIVGYTVVLAATYQLERAVDGSPYQLGADFTLSAVLIYLIGTELLSLIENTERLTGLNLRVFSGKRIFERLYEHQQAPKPTEADPSVKDGGKK
jgi:phage-related holin